MEERNRNVLYLAAFSVSLASATVGSFISWTTPVLPKFYANETKIHITENDIAWIVSMSSLGHAGGSLSMRYVADRFGRRATLLGSALPVTIGSIIVVCASQAWMLCIARFLWGVGAGMLKTICGVYFAETADKDIRGTLTLASKFMLNFGGLLMMTIGPFVSYETVNYMLMGMLLTYFVTCVWVPETPYFYLKEGKVDQARKVLKKVRGYKDEKILDNELAQMQAQVKNEMRRSSTAVELFTGKQYRKAITIAFGLKLVQTFGGTSIIHHYMGVIMQQSQTSIPLSTTLIVFGAVRFLVGIMSSALADRVNRRPLLIYTFLGNGVSLMIVAIYFFFLDVIRIDTETLKPYGILTFIGLISSSVISTLGYNSLLFVIPAEIFPLNVKSIAMMFLSISSAFMHFVVARGYQLIKDMTGLSGVFFIFTVASVGGAVFSAWYVPETKGKSLREIQIELQGDLYEANNSFRNEIKIETKSKELEELVMGDVSRK